MPKIADLHFQLYLNNHNDANIIKRKFRNYVINDVNNYKRTTRVFFKSEKNITTNQNIFYLPLLDFTEQFKLFNDLFRQVVINILSKNNGLLLHGSSIIYHNKGIIFIGDEGAGKSTVRKLLSHFASLGDDTALIRKIGKEYFLFGSPFYQRTNMAYPPKKVHIAGIFLLKQSFGDMVQRLSFLKSIKAILANIFKSPINDNQKNEEKEIMINTIDLVNKVKLYKLYFTKTVSFWRIICYTLAFSKRLNIQNLIKRINPGALYKISTNMNWNLAFCSRDFLGQCEVINELSWEFEFNKLKKVKDIANLIIKTKIDSAHIQLIAKYRKTFGNNKNTCIIMIKNKDKFTIIDGNHHAIALYLLGNTRRTARITCLIGEENPTPNN